MLAPIAQFDFNPNWPAGTPQAATYSSTHQQYRRMRDSGVWILFSALLWKIAEILRHLA